MSASATSKKQCVTCSKSGGILICDGCKQTFCGKHVIEHRQQLGTQLDQIMEKFDGLQQEVQRPAVDNNELLNQINQWEIQSILRIREAAEEARKSLEKMINTSRDGMKKSLSDIAEKLRSSREADDFSEVDLSEWSERIEQLKLEATKPSSIKIDHDKARQIRLIRVKNVNDSNDASVKATTETPTKQDVPLGVQERFSEKLGHFIRMEDDFVRKNSVTSSEYSYLRGGYSYQSGCHTTRFRIEQSQKPYRIFFGCMSSAEPLKENCFDCRHTVGWFGSDQVYEHGRCTSNVSKYGYSSSKIQTNDELHLILDCDQRQVRLHQLRLNKTCKLNVNISLAPLPWQFLVVLYHHGDAVRILPNI